MDLSTLPLMPSMDLPPPVEVPVPTAQRPSFDTSSNWQPEEQAIAGCTCQVCHFQRERDLTASSMRQQYDSAVPPTPWIDTASMSAQSARDIYASVADAFSGAVTGRISAAQPAMANIPRAAPPMQSPSRIRGRYTNDINANRGMAGRERWLDPSTGHLYDDASVRGTSNSGLSRQDDGTWVTPTNMVWEAT